MRPSLLLLAALAASPAVAQDLTDEELLARLLAQRDAFRATQEGDLGATRGLDLVSITDLQTVPDVAPSAVSVAPAALGSAQSGDDLPAVGQWDGPILASDGPQPPLADTSEDTPVVASGPAVPTGPGPAVEAESPQGPLALASTGDAPAVPGLEGPAVSPATGATVLATVGGTDRLDLGAAADTATPTPVVFGVLPPDLQVNLRITFEFDSAVIGSDQMPRLEQLCRVMRDSGIGVFRIVGHTDASGTDLYNERLSLLRAQEVRRWFISDCGLAPESLEAIGLGERFLQDPADPRAADNRRVEFQALS